MAHMLFKAVLLRRVISSLALCGACFLPCLHAQSAVAHSQFTNPLLPTGPDPWVFAYKGNYYYMNTTSKNLTIRKTKDISALASAEKKVVWTPEPGQPWSKELWAPELHRWDGKWYIYFAADAGKNESHRIFVVENPSDDPMLGTWTLKGQVSDNTNRWAIDPDIFEVGGTHYLLWSGWQGDHDGEQDIFIARMRNPWTLDSPRTMIASPRYAWEKVDDRLNASHVNVNEGPEGLVHGEKVFVVYSGSGCWTDSYELGVLEASTTANLLDRNSWKKFDHPFFKQDPKAGVYGPGHNGFFKSPDGKQDWLIYHANSGPGQGCSAARSPRIQPFTWNADGTPDFGTPVPPGRLLDKPSN